MKNSWNDFLFTVSIRMMFGAIAGALASVLLGWKTVLSDMSQSGFPVQRVLIWALAGALICAFTTPRKDHPW